MERAILLGILALPGLLGCSGDDPVGMPSPATGGAMMPDASIASGGSDGSGGLVESDGSMQEPRNIAAKALSLTYHAACALLADGHSICWGQNRVDPPAELAFKKVFPRGSFACGELLSGGVQCWGDNTLGQTDVPDVAYSDVSIGGGGGCLIDLDGQLSCWGSVAYRLPSSPLPAFDRIYLNATDRNAACGLTAAGELTCWGDFSAAPVGTFDFVSVGDRYACALTESGDVSCFGADGLGMASPPAGVAFKTVSAHGWFSCGITVADQIRCWGDPAYGVLEVPEGAFSDVQVGQDFACGIRKADQRVQCWGNGSMGQLDVPLEEDSK